MLMITSQPAKIRALVNWHFQPNCNNLWMLFVNRLYGVVLNAAEDVQVAAVYCGVHAAQNYDI